MDADSDNLQRVAAVLSEKVKDRTFERLARGLESSFPVVRHLTDDAIADAVERTLERARKRPIDDPVGYAYVAARNALRRSAKNRAQQPLGEEALSELSTAPFEDDVVSEFELDRIRDGVKAWTNEHIRTVILVVIDAAREGAYLSLAEITGAASQILGRELEPGSVKTWKRRGIRDLAKQYSLNLGDEEDIA